MKQLFKTSLVTLLFVSPFTFANDPFIQSWYYNDGTKTYSLTISPSHAPGQTYRIDYTSPQSGSLSTDMCLAIASDAFTCSEGGGETAQLDLDLHAVKFHTIGNETLYYYDPNHMPTLPDFLGLWHTQTTNPYTGVITDDYLVISKGSTNNHYLVGSKFVNSGGYCDGLNSSDKFDFVMTQNPDGTQTFVHDQPYAYQSFVYDPQQKVIISADLNKDSKLAQCVFLQNHFAFSFSKLTVAHTFSGGTVA